MKIALIANIIDPVQGLNAGTHVHWIEVAKRWSEEDITVFAPALARDAILSHLPRVRFEATPSLDRLIDVEKHHYPAFLARALLAPAMAPKLQDCDVALATTHFLQDIIPAAYAMGHRAAFTIWHTLAAPWRGGHLGSAPTYFSERLSLGIARSRLGGVVSGSELMLREHGLDNAELKRVITVNGVEHLLKQNASPAAQAVGSDAVFLGRLWPTKGIEDLLDAWSIVSAKNERATLRILGDGEPGYRAQLEARVAADPHLRRSTTFLGRVSEERKHAELRAAKMFVFPSREEGWGIALAEAMALGLPCVTYDLPVFREVFGDGRLHVPVGDVAAMAAAIERLLTDEDERSTLARAALRSMASMTWDSAAAIELGLLEKLATARDKNSAKQPELGRVPQG